MLARLLALASLASIAGLGCASFTPPLTSPAHGGAAWTELASKHFTVRTDLSASEGTAILADLEGIYTTFKDVAFPSDSDTHDRVDVVLFARRKDFDVFAPPLSAAYFTPALANDLEPVPTMVLPGALTARGRLDLQHELTHHFLHRSLGAMPPWLNEGMAQYYSTLRIDDGKAILGEPLPNLGFLVGGSWRSVRSGAWNQALIPVAQVPSVAQLLAADRSTFYRSVANPTVDDSRAQTASYGGAWALVHFLNDGPDAYRLRYVAFLTALQRATPEKLAWKQAFGDLDPAQIEADFRAYLRSPETPLRVTAYTPRPPAPPERARAMSDADVHLLWARLRAWTNASLPAAQRDLDEALASDADSAEVHFWRGHFAARTRDLAGAEQELDAALAAKPEEPRYLLARAELLEGSEELSSLPARSATRLAGLVERLGRVATSAAELNFVSWYLAALGRSNDGLPLAERAVKADPTCAACLDTYALLLSQKGRHEDALAMQERALDLMPETMVDQGMLDRFHRYAVIARVKARRRRERPR